MVTRLSVNLNKVATLRNARGGAVPSLADAVDVCLEAGCHGITVHPRADQRHITPDDVRLVARALASRCDGVEFNIEGDPRPDLVELVLATAPDQCTLVPVRPGEITSEAGWDVNREYDTLAAAIQQLRRASIRVSLFVEPTEAAVAWAASLQADRVELYTEPYARAGERGDAERQRALSAYIAASTAARRAGLGVNAGHDLDLSNLGPLVSACRPDEVSIGHALISRALFVGLERTVREYLELLSAAALVTPAPETGA
ncbi:MAG: pyridoxine 5'-phosphate synthase [Myxococcales bacterium FL481]|nr:MAG: pyridoxine 5'-phosphate synthase [Myxococcales bacterium FL481]